MARRVVLTDYAWPDTATERGVLEAAGLELVVGPGHGRHRRGGRGAGAGA